MNAPLLYRCAEFATIARPRTSGLRLHLLGDSQPKWLTLGRERLGEPREYPADEDRVQGTVEHLGVFLIDPAPEKWRSTGGTHGPQHG
jgi:hypothetical protein